MRNQGNKSSPKDNNNPTISKFKGMKCCNSADKDFKIVVLRKLNEIQENEESQLNEIRKIIHEQNEKSSKEIEIIKKDQIEILELKNSVNEMRNAIESIYSRIDQTDDRNSDLKDKNFEIIQSEQNKGKKKGKSEDSLHDLLDTFKCTHSRVTGVPEGEKRGMGRESI